MIAPLGLSLSKEKTRVVHINEGIDFLGWRIKRQKRRSDGRWFVFADPSKRRLRLSRRRLDRSRGPDISRRSLSCFTGSPVESGVTYQ